LADVRQNGLPPLAPSIAKIPVIGETISNFYLELQDQPRETIARHGGQIRMILHEILTRGVGVFGAAVEIILGIILSAFFLSGGEKVLHPVSRSLSHILGEEDANSLLSTSAMAIKGVSVGIMGAALIAAIIAWIGLLIAGIPFSLGIAAIVFFLVIIQVGPLPVWIPVVAWLFYQGHTGQAVFMICYGIALLAIDAVLKPVLIAKSGKLPLLVILIGVIGGVVAWGFTGMFKGAIIVAVFYTVFINWLERKEAETSPAT
jgi:predicted PurR-regulated permease PerM